MKVELSPEARALIEAGRDTDGPSAAQRARIDRRLSATLGAAALGGVSLASQSAAAAVGTKAGGLGKAAGLFGQLSAGAKLATAVVVIGGGVGLGTLWVSHASQPAPARQADTAEPQEPASEPAVTPSQAPAARVPPAADPAPTRDRRGSTVQPAAAKAYGSRARAPSLQRELALLGAAQDRLREGEPARALRLLERHKRRFPKGALSQERRAARAIALCLLGRRAEGQRLARELARRAPDSPLVARVGEACVGAATAAP